MTPMTKLYLAAAAAGLSLGVAYQLTLDEYKKRKQKKTVAKRYLRAFTYVMTKAENGDYDEETPRKQIEEDFQFGLLMSQFDD